MSTSPSEDPLERLLFECLEALERGGDTELERLLEANPVEAEVLRRRLGALSQVGLAGTDDDSFPERLGEFALLERLGHGGMGVVYRAHQSSLDREVALKLVRPDQLYFPGARARFRREVETIGGLHHPGIVPIHAVGEQAGIPYYAMELIAGVTLADVLRELSGRDVAELDGRDFARAIATGSRDRSSANSAYSDVADDPGAFFDGSWVEVSLRIVREVGEALEHAHRRGVVHRDVKPTNVMVTSGGRVLLVDFGLASTAGAVPLTRSGSQPGTLPYMSPEQLGGGRVDERTDVYALGALLWELLTLEAPYSANTPEELIARIRAGRRPALRARNGRVRWEHETVCETALQVLPEKRYPSAAAFVHDVDAVLLHRPIAARPTPPLVRFTRWIQHRPAMAAALALGVIALIAGPFGWGLRADLARREAVEAAERERGLRQETEQHYDTALDAVGEVLRRMAGEWLRDSPELQQARLDAIDRVQGIFDELLTERPDDPRLRWEASRGWQSRGTVLVDFGRYEEALLEFERAVAGFRELIDEGGEPGERAARLLGPAEVHVATALQNLGRFDEALVAGEAAIASLRASRPELGPMPELSTALRRRATVLQSLGRLDEAEDAYEAAVEEARLARDHDAANGMAAWDLGITLEGLADLAEIRGLPERAREFADQSVAALREACEQRPGYRSFEVALGDALGRRGVLLAGLGEHEAGLRDLRASVTDLERLVAAYPDFHHERFALLANRARLAHLLTTREGGADEARRLMLANVRDAEALWRATPERTALRYSLAMHRHNYAQFLSTFEASWEEVAALEEQVFATVQALLQTQQDLYEYRILADRSSYGATHAACELGPPERARERLDEHLEREPVDARSRYLAAKLWAYLWQAHERSGSEPGLLAEAEDRLVETLRQAAAAGFRRNALATDDELFAPFRGWSEFDRAFEALSSP